MKCALVILCLLLSSVSLSAQGQESQSSIKSLVGSKMQEKILQVSKPTPGSLSEISKELEMMAQEYETLSTGLRDCFQEAGLLASDSELSAEKSMTLVRDMMVTSQGLKQKLNVLELKDKAMQMEIKIFRIGSIGMALSIIGLILYIAIK